MASSGSVFSETLRSITTTKLEELSKKRDVFEKHYSAVKHAVAQQQDNSVGRFRVLADGVITCFDIRTETNKEDAKNIRSDRLRIIRGGTLHGSLETDLENLSHLFDQTRFDAGVSAKLIARWENTMWQHLAVQSARYQYATLYGQLVAEWLAAEKAAAVPKRSGVDMEAFDEIANANKLRSREQWEESVFEPALVDQHALRQYLGELFRVTRGEDRQPIQAALEALKKAVRGFEASLDAGRLFSPGTLAWTMKSLSNSDLLKPEKRAALLDFLQNEIVLDEIADVLNMRMAALETWNWGGEVSVEHRVAFNRSD